MLFHPYIFSVENRLLHLQLNPSNPELIERKGINFETVLERKKNPERKVFNGKVSSCAKLFGGESCCLYS